MRKLGKTDYQKLLALSEALTEVGQEQYYESLLKLLEQLFGWRQTLVFIQDIKDGIAQPETIYTCSLTMSREILEGSVRSYQNDPVLYRAMRKRRAVNEWKGVTFTSDLTEKDYRTSTFIRRLNELGFAQAAVLSLSMSPHVCIAVCLGEEEADDADQNRLLFQKVSEILSKHTGRLHRQQSGCAERRQLRLQMEESHLGYAAVDGSGRLLRINKEAETLCREMAPYETAENAVNRILHHGLSPENRENYHTTRREDVYFYAGREYREQVLLIRRRNSGLLSLNLPAAGELGLTEREHEIAELLLQGKHTADIAGELSISTNTVKVHTANIYRKLEVKNRMELIRKIGRHSFVKGEEYAGISL